MKTAREWAESFPTLPTTDGMIDYVRQIQADALRYAADLSGDTRGSFLHTLADRLDPQPPRPKA